jgi:arylsulfatase A-like enzyme
MRNERWKIIEFFGSTPQRYEFYDLQSDPFENFDMVANSLWTLQSFTAFRDLRNEMAKLVQ